MNLGLFADVLRSEWTKLRSVRSTYWTLIAAIVVGFGLSAGAAAATAHAYHSHFSAHDRATFDPTATSLAGLFFAQLVLGVFAVIVMCSEYSTGTIRTTTAAVPQRGYVLAAKALLVFGVATVIAEGVAFAGYSLGQAIYRSHHIPQATSLSDPGVLRAVVGGGLAVGVLTLFAIGLATIIRHLAGALTVLLGIMFVLQIILSFLPDSWQRDFVRYLPPSSGGAIANVVTSSTTLSPWAGFSVFCGWAALMLAIGWYLLRTRDV